MVDNDRSEIIIQEMVEIREHRCRVRSLDSLWRRAVWGSKLMEGVNQSLPGTAKLVN